MRRCEMCDQPVPARGLRPGYIVRLRGTNVLGVVPNSLVLNHWAAGKGNTLAVIVLSSGSVTWRLPQELEIVHGFFRVQSTEAL